MSQSDSQLSQSGSASGHLLALQVNGQVHHCAPETALPDLLRQLNMDPRLVAVEYNGEILHRQFWETTLMQAGDRLEVVTIVGGG